MGSGIPDKEYFSVELLQFDATMEWELQNTLISGTSPFICSE
jgi:hypothetical protein